MAMDLESSLNWLQLGGGGGGGCKRRMHSQEDHEPELPPIGVRNKINIVHVVFLGCCFD